MNILMLNYEFPPLGGGGGVAAYKLARGFVERGYHVDYVTTWFRGLNKEETVDGIQVHRVKVIGREELPTATTQSMFSFPFAAYTKCVQLINKSRYAFLNSHFAIPSGLLGIILSKQFSIPHILSIHGGDIYDPSKSNSPHRKWYLAKTVRFVLNSSDIIIAQSTNTKSNAIKYYNPKKDIDIIPLPYDLITFPNITRKELGLKEQKKYLISVGRLVKRKDYLTLIRALASISNEDIELLIIGEGPEKDLLLQEAMKLNIVDRIHLLGFVSEERKFQFLEKADIFVLSSLHEGFGIVLQEAMQVGLPIVATNIGGQTDLVIEGRNGLLVKPQDPKSLSEKINYLLQNDSERRKISTNNLNKIKEYQTRNITKEYIRTLVKYGFHLR